MLSIHSCPIGDLGTKNTGGMSVYIQGLTRELGINGHRVDIFTRRHDEKHPAVIELSDHVRLIHIGLKNDNDLGKLEIYPRVKDFTASLDEFKKTNQMTYDVIHSHYWLSGLVGEELCTLWKIPHVMMFHTLGAVKNSLNVGEKEPDIRITGEKALVKSCHSIVAPTVMEKENTLLHYQADPSSVTVIPCGVDQKMFRPVDWKTARRKLGIGSDEKVILYVGRIEPLKGVDRIIESLVRIKKKMTVRLIIVGGDGPHSREMSTIREIIHKSGLDEQVIFAGRVKHQELPLYYSAADALVVASYYESFGLVALEALSCGTPVVSTKVGGMASVIVDGETGALVDDDTVKSMGDAIYDVLSGSMDYREKKKAIRESVSEFSWSFVAEKMTATYLSLLN